MGTVKEIALVFCATAVMLSGVSLLGSGALEKSKRYIIALVLLCSVLGSVVGADFDFTLPDLPNTEASANLSENMSAYQTEYLVAQLLNDAKIKYQKITAKANKNQDGSIIITEITVSGVEDEERARETILSVGIDCRVAFD